MTKILKKETIYIREEVNGAEAVIVSADAVRVMNISPAPEGLRIVDRSGSTGGMGNRASLYGGSMVAFSFDSEIAVSGRALEQARLLEAAGFMIDEGEIRLIDKEFKTFTVLLDQDGVGRTILNARATACSFAATTGDTLKMSITLAGYPKREIDTPSPISPAFNLAVPLVCVGAVADLMGVPDVVIETFNLDMGLEAAIVPDMLNEDGYAPVRITNRNITGSFNPEMETVAVGSWFNKLADDATAPITIKFSRGSDALTFTIPSPKITDVQDGDRSGIRVKEVSFQAAITGIGNNEFYLSVEE